ncbi:MAG: hypothetical protein IT342_22015 [Candidatus Melainabacteria bacterium]|nr:hypothetical protein [Candidatus Melainabacteria bacterium]
MNEPKTSSRHRWLILSFILPCLVIGFAAAGICIWDMWGSSEHAEIALGAIQSFIWFGVPSGLMGIPVGYVINQIRMRGLWG